MSPDGITAADRRFSSAFIHKSGSEELFLEIQTLTCVQAEAQTSVCPDSSSSSGEEESRKVMLGHGG